jgi:tight adherence protein B
VSALIVAALAAALWLTIGPGRRQTGRFRRVLVPGPRGDGRRSGSSGLPRGIFRCSVPPGGPKQAPGSVPMTVVVQQLAALLRGGRTPSRLWDELSVLYPAGDQEALLGPRGRSANGIGGGQDPGSAFQLVLAAARAASLRGAAVSDAIRSATASAFPSGRGRDRRVWGELAACFDIAEVSGCPLADVLTRFAAQLEAEDDAEAARQTALAGPQTTVRLLTWLPLLGLLLGMALGVDPLKILLGTPYGVAALAAGIALTVAGRVWSARLVRLAAGPP